MERKRRLALCEMLRGKDKIFIKSRQNTHRFWDETESGGLLVERFEARTRLLIVRGKGRSGEPKA